MNKRLKERKREKARDFCSKPQSNARFTRYQRLEQRLGTLIESVNTLDNGLSYLHRVIEENTPAPGKSWWSQVKEFFTRPLWKH